MLTQNPIAGLTGANYSYIYEQCGIDDSKNNDKYYNIATYTKYTLDNPEIAAEFYTGLNWLGMLYCGNEQKFLIVSC